jgi:hypothetical protein
MQFTRDTAHPCLVLSLLEAYHISIVVQILDKDAVYFIILAAIEK